MRKKILRVFSLIALICFLGINFAMVNAYAEEDEATEVDSGTSISLTPVSKVLQLSSNSVYEDSFEVKNDGKSPMRIEVYAAPYSYIYSESEESYKLGFNNENNYTQITRWITFKDNNGDYVKTTTFSIEPEKSINVYYRVSTPDNIPSGGQYAVIFAHTLASTSSSGGIRTEASPGLVVYGRSNEGEAIISAEISDLKIEQGTVQNNTTSNNFYASAKVKNTGNVDFTAYGTMKVEGLFGAVKYETPSTSGRLSVIPESELVIADEWGETPSFGFFKVTWTVRVGEQTETVERTVFLISPMAIIITIILLTFIIVWVTIRVRRRKERRSRLAV